jgi:tripartite ATP-independent transporter DctM subunit
MEPIGIGILTIIIFLVLLFSGFYVAVALGIAGLIGMTALVGFEPAMGALATQAFHYGTQYSFIIIPLFVAMGLFAAEGGVSKDAYDAMAKWLGGIKGGLGHATIGACAMFGTLTGSSIITAVVFAKTSVPEMRRLGYDAKLSYGLVSSAGAIGLLIPPNLLAVVYALLTEESLGKLLMAGIGPGIVLTLCLSLGFVGILVWRPSWGPAAGEQRATWRERIASVPKLWSILVVAFVVIGGIYFGIFTVNEASGIGTLLLLVLYLCIKGFSKQSWQVIMSALRESLSFTAMILLILIGSQVFARAIVLSQIGPTLSEIIIGWHLSPLQFVIAMTVVYLILGCFIDGISTMAITIPIVYPIVSKMGIDNIWFATVMIVATQIGNITPPFGLCVYAVKAVAGPEFSIGDIFKGALPFLFFELVCQAIVIAFPAVSLWIPYNIWTY